jgi:hypothetical protein
MQIVFVEACDLDQLQWVCDLKVPTPKRHCTSQAKLLEDAIYVHRRHAERVRKYDL